MEPYPSFKEWLEPMRRGAEEKAFFFKLAYRVVAAKRVGVGGEKAERELGKYLVVRRPSSVVHNGTKLGKALVYLGFDLPV